ncbi:MAG: IS66 family transposase [Shewanella sp.]|nr:IS66 family transposase [Shewanella sp.]
MTSKPVSHSELANDIAGLKQLLASRDQTIRHLQAQVDKLEEEKRQLLGRQFGPSREKGPTPQMRLFNEPEELVEQEGTGDEETVTVPAHKRRKSGRKPLPAHLPRKDVEHDLPAEEKVCSCGCQLTRIGEEVSEQLDIIPAKIRVLRHIRPKYACRGCEETLRTAPMPPQPIPKSNASPGLLSHIVVAKYQDALPLARQEKQFARIGAEISRASMARWMIQLGTLVQVLIQLLRERMLEYDYIGMDETRIQVLKEKDRIAASQSCIWAQQGGPPGQSIILFQYTTSKAAKVAETLLEDFTGFLQVDGNPTYDTLEKAHARIRLVGCMAHARRKFVEANKAQGKKGKPGKARKGLSLIQKLYAIEQSIKEKTPGEKQLARTVRSLPVLDELYAWASKSVDEVPPTSLMGKALHYLLAQWPKLIRYVEDGRVSIDNNATERAIRPFVIGRRNWLFADTPAGATASANLYSLIETARANGLEPYDYLARVFRQLPAAETLEQVEALLPWHLVPLDDITPAE